MLLATLLAAAVAAASPVHQTSPCPSPTQTGTFRFTALTKDSTNAKIGMIVLENIQGCLEATVLTDEGGPAIIDHIEVAGDMLTGNIRVSNGTAKVTLKFTAAGITGSIVDGRKEWSLAGRRTSGTTLDVAVK